MSETERKTNFIENILPKLILERNEELQNHSIVKCSANMSDKLDGFMSSIFHIELVLKDKSNDRTKTLKLIGKLMKGDKNFREYSKSYVQCSNEVHIYKNVIPTYQNFVKNLTTTFNSDEWIPKTYYADYKIFPELSDQEEALLVMEDLQPLGYRVGTRIDLDEPHLRLMAEHIAQYHAVYHCMKIRKDSRLPGLIDGMKPFNFVDDAGKPLPSYHRLFEIGLMRIFTLVKNNPEYQTDPEFVRLIGILETKYGNNPTPLMQSFLKYDETFTVLLHGDYNRNNVLFQYDKPDGYENPRNIRMIDFQETRYASCVIDLAFFMYMNMPGSIRPQLWDQLLKFYHENLITAMADILKCKRDDPVLEPYSWENFLDHFKKHVFYGVMVIIHFLPWMACPEDECQKMSDYFEQDMYSEELKDIAQICGGKDVDDRLMDVVLHAYNKEFLEFLKESLESIPKAHPKVHIKEICNHEEIPGGF